jgi:hypothetical protein
VIIDVDSMAGALVLSTSPRWEGVEIEICPESEPSARRHVWVLSREGRNETVYAAVFNRLTPGRYDVLTGQGLVQTVVTVVANEVTFASIDDG